jgi:hypothetical protein
MLWELSVAWAEILGRVSLGKRRVGEAVSHQDHERGGTDEHWFSSVGNVAAPLLAGFSFTAVITLSNDTGHRRWPGITLLAFTMATVSLMAALEFSKYVRDNGKPVADRERVESWTRNFYHLGIVTVLLGLGLALAPQHVTGLQDTVQWVASAVAFVGSGVAAVSLVPGVYKFVISRSPLSRG